MKEESVLAQERPIHPYAILATAIVLPGVGHVLARLPGRGLTFLFFMLLLGWVSYHLTTPEHSFLGRYAGGLLIYAISILDAYKLARLRWERYRRGLAPHGG
jgi:hypothetical protein